MVGGKVSLSDDQCVTVRPFRGFHITGPATPITESNERCSFTRASHDL
jgi:hypothetical protein